MASSSAECPYVDRVLADVHRYAMARGLGREDAEDCAGDLAVRVALRGRIEPACPRKRPCELCLGRRIKHHVANYIRARARLGRHETPWPASVTEERSALARHAPDAISDPEAALLRHEAAAALNEAALQLDERQRRILARFYGRGETCAEIAAALRMTAHAVRQGLVRARHRLGGILETRGYSAEGLLAEFRPPPRPALWTAS